MTKFTPEALEGSRLPIFVAGEFRASQGQPIACFDPATGAEWCQVADATTAEVDAAVEAARAAMLDPAWRDISQSDRGLMLGRLADLVARDVERLSRLETKDNGKILREMRALTQAVSNGLRYFAGMADKVQGTTIPVNKPDMLNFTLREPVGVIGAIVPWNSPLLLLNRCMAPALAMGNALVVKPSEHASAAVLALAELVQEAGFPPGVFNVVTGYGASVGDAIVRHPGVNKIDFTGGTATGRLIAGRLP